MIKFRRQDSGCKKTENNVNGKWKNDMKTKIECVLMNKIK